MAGGGKILVVEDEPINIKLLACLLEPSYEVLFATNGYQAIDVAESARPDLILLDLVMPGMDGYEVCAALKQSPAAADIPVIFVTARIAGAEQALWLAAGAVDYIVKPFSPRDVLARVQRCLDSQQRARREADQA